jgi:integrase
LTAAARLDMGATVPLSLLVDRRFVPDCCGGKSAEYASSFRAAVRLWGAELGRPATNVDFTVEGVAAFLNVLPHAGYNVNRIRSCRTRLLTLWRYAHRVGLAGRCEPVKVDAIPVLLQLPSADRPEPAPRVFSIYNRPLNPGTVRGYFALTFKPQALLSKSQTLIGEHESAQRSLWRHYGELELTDQTDQLAAEHFAWMKDKGRKSNWSINHVRRAWFTQWRHAHAGGLVAKLPTLRALKVGRGAPDAWTIDEMKRLLGAADPWWRAILLVGYWTLQRRRALLSIPDANVDLAGGWIDFPPSSIKTDDGIRCRIGPDAVAALRAFWPATGGLLFRWETKKLKALHEQFGELLRRAEVRPSVRKNGQFHKLRRTGATHAVIKGGMAVVCDLLGQSSIYVTKRYIDKTQLPGHDVTRLLPVLTDEAF